MTNRITVPLQNAVKALQQWQWYGASPTGLYSWSTSDDEILKELGIKNFGIQVHWSKCC